MYIQGDAQGAEIGPKVCRYYHTFTIFIGRVVLVNTIIIQRNSQTYCIIKNDKT